MSTPFGRLAYGADVARTDTGMSLEGAKTWVHKLFEGVLTNETRCLTCETVRLAYKYVRRPRTDAGSQVTSRDEAFLDLSIDIEPNSSVTSCLRQFSASEMLCQRNKFSCDQCCGLQEAEKRFVPSLILVLAGTHRDPLQNEDQKAAQHLGTASQALQVRGESPATRQAHLPRRLPLRTPTLQHGGRREQS